MNGGASGAAGSQAALLDEMKMSREHALLGNYEASLVYFDGVVAKIMQHLRTVDDAHVRAQWLKAKEDLTAEFRVVKGRIERTVEAAAHSAGERRSALLLQRWHAATRLERTVRQLSGRARAKTREKTAGKRDI